MSKLKGCPLLIQSDTNPSCTIAGESHTRSYMLQCLQTMCAAYDPEQGKCNRFRTIVKIEEDKPCT